MPSFNTLQNRLSLRRLKTAFGPSSPSLSITSISPSTSPLSDSSPTHGVSHFASFSHASLPQQHSKAEPGCYFVQRKKSMAELEQEEERNSVALAALVGLVEPRPFAGFAVGGIEEVMSGVV